MSTDADRGARMSKYDSGCSTLTVRASARLCAHGPSFATSRIRTWEGASKLWGTWKASTAVALRHAISLGSRAPWFGIQWRAALEKMTSYRCAGVHDSTSPSIHVARTWDALA